MVSDSELAARVHEFLRGSDLKKTTNNIVRRKLEKDFGVDLSDRRPFLREQVDRFLQTQYDNSEEEGGEIESDHDEGDDDVSDSEDECYDGGEAMAHVGVQKNNGSSSFRGINKFSRLGNHTKEKSKRSRSGNFCTLSPQLQKFLGVPNMARTEVVKHLWSYVREKNLQDPLDGKNIICDETLRDLLGVDSINILQINKALTKHIWPSASARSVRKEKQQKQDRAEEPDGTETKLKRQKKVYSGFLAPLPLSDTLMKFLGTGEHALTRADVIKRVWEYIKDKNLQDPSDKKTVVCDEKLKELFKVDSFHGFTVSKLLTVHFLKS